MVRGLNTIWARDWIRFGVVVDFLLVEFSSVLTCEERTRAMSGLSPRKTAEMQLSMTIMMTRKALLSFLSCVPAKRSTALNDCYIFE